MNTGPVPVAKVTAVSGSPAAARDTVPLRAARPKADRPAAVVPSAAIPSKPRRELFPTPEPLSGEDRILLQWAQSGGSGWEQLLDRLPLADQVPGKIPVAALQIPALTVEPIAIPVLEPDK